MKIAVVSDLHISNWLSYSTLDRWGRPSRLTQYLQLAEDFRDFGLDRDVDLNVIAGDVVESAVCRPQVLEVVQEFLRVVSGEVPTLLIHGQHDLDVKSAEISAKNSILTSVADVIEGVRYFSEPGCMEMGGLTFHVQPWNQWNRLEHRENADVFVGHGLVAGAANNKGYIFRNGFDVDELYRQYRLSIVGDIHRGRVYRSGRRAVLIPGTPIQNSWKDDERCGFWMVNLAAGDAAPEVEFGLIHDLRPDFYHRFLELPGDVDVKMNGLTHVRKCERVTKHSDSNLNSDGGVKEMDGMLAKIGDEVISESKRGEHVRRLFHEILDAAEIDESRDMGMSSYKVVEVEVENFLSISHVKMDLRPHRRTVIIGRNGSGKTSLVEAILWCLTGTTTKDVRVGSLGNRNRLASRTCVRVVLEGAERDLCVTRSREDDKPGLTIVHRSEDGEWRNYRGGSVRQTDKELSEILGLSSEDIRMYAYFSTAAPMLMGELTASARNDLVSRASGMQVVDRLREQAKQKHVDASRMCGNAAGSITSMRGSVENIKKNLSSIENIDEAALREDVEKLTEQLESQQRREKLEMDIDMVDMQIDRLEKDLDVTNKNIKKLHADLESISQGRCPLCGGAVSPGDGRQERLRVELAKNEELLDKTNEDIAMQKGRLAKLAERRRGEPEVQVYRHELLDELDAKRKDLAKFDSLSVFLGIIKEQQAHIRSTEAQLMEYRELEKDYGWLCRTMLVRGGAFATRVNATGAGRLREIVDGLVSGTPLQMEVSDEFGIRARFECGWIDYPLLSSGQKRIVDVVLMVAMNAFFSEKYGVRGGILGFCVFDETMSFLDPGYADICKTVMERSQADRIFMISHDDRLLDMFDDRVYVRLEDGESKYDVRVMD